MEGKEDEEVQQLQAENQHLRIRIQELEVENARIGEQLQAMPVASPRLSRDQLHSLRDRIVSNWRVTKAPEKKERIKEALDRFISELSSVQSSTPENHTSDSRTNARIGLAKGGSP